MLPYDSENKYHIDVSVPKWIEKNQDATHTKQIKENVWCMIFSWKRDFTTKLQRDHKLSNICLIQNVSSYLNYVLNGTRWQIQCP